MPFLSPSQLIVLLWLVATAAPAATVLLNGFLLPLPPLAAEASRHESLPGKDTIRRGSVTQASAVRRRVAPVWPFAADLRAAGSVSISASERFENLGAPSSSVLHTAVQRRRPKDVRSDIA